MFKTWFGARQKQLWNSGEPIIDQIRRWDGDKPLRLVEPAPSPALLKAMQDTGAESADRSQEARLVTEFLELIRLLMIKGNEQARGALYQAAVLHPLTSLVDVILHELHRQSWWQAAKIRSDARWFVNESRHTEPLRFGIALLGLSGDEDDLPLLETVARHEEFTIAAANSVAAIVSNPVQEWWRMAQQVKGWGKVHLVKRLARRCENRPDVQDWLLRQGWQDCAGPEYTAYSCAQAGRLEQALAAENVDDELLAGAAVLIGAMLAAGPAEHLEDYEGGVDAISRWLKHVQPQKLDGKSKETLKRIRQWVSHEEQPQVWERRAEQLGWTDEIRKTIAGQCDALLEPCL